MKRLILKMNGLLSAACHSFLKKEPEEKQVVAPHVVGCVFKYSFAGNKKPF